MVSALRKRSDPPNKAPLPLARCLLGSFLADPPTASSHPQAQRGRGKGRGRGARGGKAKRSRVRSPSPPPAVTSPEDERVDDEPVSHSLVSEGVVDEGLSSEAPTADEEAPTADEEAPTVDEEASTIDEEALTPEDAGFIQVEEGKSVYMRGSSTLPEERGLPVEQRPCIAPYGESGWKKVGAGERNSRHVNGILGILIKEHYPGMVTLPGEGKVLEPARTWDHYIAYEDLGVANNIEFHNKAERVFAELWDFYRCEDGKLEEARAVVNGHCPKLVRNLMHEARPLAVRTYMATQGYMSHDKKAGRKFHLDKEQYMEVIPRWCADKGDCWERIVDYWCSKEYRAVNKEFSRRREAMQDPPHHQGNLNVKEYGERWASYHKAPLPNLFLSYALAHKGPYRTATPYDENDPPSAYTSKTSYDRMEKFKGKAKELKGPDYDVTTEPLDHALVMISGDGRKHGKEAIAGGMFPRSSCRSLPEYKARLGLSKSSICQHSTPAMVEMEARLAEERRLQVEERRLADERLEARLAEERQLAEARLVEERRLADARLAEERRLADEKEKRALLAQSSQCFAMFAAYCAQNGMPAMQMPHQSGHGSNTDGSSHAPGPSGNNLGGTPNL